MMFVQNRTVINIVSVTAKFLVAQFLALRGFSFWGACDERGKQVWNTVISTFRQLKRNVLTSAKILFEEVKYI